MAQIKKTQQCLDFIKHYQKSIEKNLSDSKRLIHCIEQLFKLNEISIDHLQETGIGRTVNNLRKHEDSEVGHAAKSLVCKWKALVADEDESSDKNQNNEIEKNESSDDNDRHLSNGLEQTKQTSQQHHSNGIATVKVEKKSNASSNSYKNSRAKYQSEDSDEKPYQKLGSTYPVKEEKTHKSSSHRKEESSRSEDKHHKSSSSRKESSDSSRHEERHQKSSSSVKSEERYSSKSGKSSSSRNYDVDNNSKLDEKRKEKKQSSNSKYQEIDFLSIQSPEEKPEKKRKHESSEESTRKEKSNKDSKKEKPNSQKYEEVNFLEMECEDEKPNFKSEDRHHREKDKEKSSSKRKHDSDSENDSSSSRNKKVKNESEKAAEDLSQKSVSKHSSKSKSSSSHSQKSDDKKSDRDKSKHHKSSTKEKDEKPKDQKKRKSVPEDTDENVIDGNAGIGFAEALSMFDHPNSKKAKKIDVPVIIHKASTSSTSASTSSASPDKQKGESSKLKSIESLKATPRLLSLNPFPLPDLKSDILSETVQISTDYRPTPMSSAMMEYLYDRPERKMTDEEAMAESFSSKNMRTKVYSGNKTFYKGAVPKLYDLCIRMLQENIPLIEYTGGLPFDILKPVLEKANPDQLNNLEYFNPYLMEESDSLWEPHVKKRFRTKQREDMESWREMYIRCTMEEENKFKSLTDNIRKLKEKTESNVRKSKIAYVDSVAKGPRNVISKQIKFGTKNLPVTSPAARVANLSMNCPNVARGIDTKLKTAIRLRDSVHASTSGLKPPKKAPLMAKSLQLLKGRLFKR